MQKEDVSKNQLQMIVSNMELKILNVMCMEQFTNPLQL